MTTWSPLKSTTSAISDTDTKRFWWLLGTFAPAIGLVALTLHMSTGWWLWLAYVPIHIFVVVPLADVVVGLDRVNLSEDKATAIKSSRYYRLLVEGYVALQYATFALVVWWIVSADAGWFSYVLLAVSIGALGGLAINAAHELGHKSDRTQQWVARVSLAQTFYGHFFVEHNRGHHRHVATPEDPASSRYGESFYAFFPRTVVNSARSAWALEADRLRRNGKPVFHWSNKNLQSWALSVVLFGAVIAYGGPRMIPFLVIQAVFGFGLLEVVNYVEHYGLLRQKLPNGRYEKVQPRHSWNSNFAVSNLYLFNLQRHSDHHANPTRPYQILRNIDESPNLPAGYSIMIMSALVPPLWFRLMNPRVAELYDGDLTKAHLTDRARAKLALSEG
jgi:alkane 1-monooxygenase